MASGVRETRMFCMKLIRSRIPLRAYAMAPDVSQFTKVTPRIRLTCEYTSCGGEPDTAEKYILQVPKFDQ